MRQTLPFVIAASHAPPTVASTVTPDTPLEALNLNWRERDLPEHERTKHVHRLHPYLGKFIPQLVEVFLRKYFAPGQTVLDPFCGSGTTLVQANELGIHSIGYDVSAFNVLLCRAKTQAYDLDRLRQEALEALHRAEAAGTAVVQQSAPAAAQGVPELAEVNSAYLREWFAPRALAQLLAYRHAIETGGYEYQDLLRVILSRSARSARLTTHFDLDFPRRPQTEPYWCYKHSRICQPTTDASRFLRRYTEDALRRVEEFSRVRTGAAVRVYHEDSRRCTLPPVDGVVTSPPYLGLIDYHDQHAYAYHLLGLEDRRDLEIGPAYRGRSGRERERYVQAIVQVLRRVLDAMPRGGPMVVVAHDTADLYPGIGEQLGVQVEAVLQRHVDRRTGRRAAPFFESVFVWRKTGAPAPCTGRDRDALQQEE